MSETRAVLKAERLGLLRLSERARKALGYAVKVIAEDHELSNGTTALYWQLAFGAEQHCVFKDKADD